MFKKLRIYSIAIVTLVFCSSAYGQLFYGGFTHSNGSNNSTLDIGPNVSFELFLEGGELPSVDALELSISLGFGSAATLPPITNLSGLGIFSDATVSFTPTDFGGEALLSIPNAAALNDNTPVAEVFFDTTGLSDGDTFIYSIDGAFIDGVSFIGVDQRYATTSVETFFATIDANAVPEPSSAGFLLALATTVMMRRKRY